MQVEKYDELERRASDIGERDEVRQMEARSRVRKEIDAMLHSGEAKTLTAEEVQLVESFRRFKLKMNKPAGMFNFQTRRGEGVAEPAEIATPAEP